MPFDARQRYESNDIKKLFCEKIGFTIVVGAAYDVTNYVRTRPQIFLSEWMASCGWLSHD